jgi:DNA-binding transcriptional MerR regulator
MKIEHRQKLCKTSAAGSYGALGSAALNWYIRGMAGQPVYSIGAVARMLDIPSSTLRAWEDRYGVVVPQRSDGSQRIYTRAQVEYLRYIKGQIANGLSAADAHRVLQGEIEAGRLPSEQGVPAEEKPLVLLAEYFLRTEGCDVCVALDGRQARLLFDERAPDLVVIDLLISGGAGFRLCREFSSEAGAQVLAVSALESDAEALRAGASAFLRKPLEPLQLVSTIRDLLGTSELAKSARRTRNVGAPEIHA